MAGQRRRWQDFFLDVYFLNVLFSKLCSAGDGSFGLLPNKAGSRNMKVGELIRWRIRSCVTSWEPAG